MNSFEVLCAFLCLLLASSSELQALLKFWVGWDLSSALTVEVIDGSQSKSSTCLETMRLPAQYQDFSPTFKAELLACINTADTWIGFGLI